MKKISVLFCFILFFAISLCTNVRAAVDYQTFEIEGYPDLRIELPDGFSDGFDNHKFLIFKNSSGTTFISSVFFDNDVDFANDIYFKVTTSNNSNYSRFYIKDSSKLAYFTNHFIRNGETNYTYSLSMWLPTEPYVFNSYEIATPLLSNFDVYHTNGTVFFSAPETPTTVELMVAMETPKMAEKIQRAMMIILACGVGCLAFLMALPVLGKVFSIFRLK